MKRLSDITVTLSNTPYTGHGVGTGASSSSSSSSFPSFDSFSSDDVWSSPVLNPNDVLKGPSQLNVYVEGGGVVCRYVRVSRRASQHRGWNEGDRHVLSLVGVKVWVKPTHSDYCAPPPLAPLPSSPSPSFPLMVEAAAAAAAARATLPTTTTSTSFSPPPSSSSSSSSSLQTLLSSLHLQVPRRDLARIGTLPQPTQDALQSGKARPDGQESSSGRPKGRAKAEGRERSEQQGRVVLFFYGSVWRNRSLHPYLDKRPRVSGMHLVWLQYALLDWLKTLPRGDPTEEQRQ